MKPPEIEPLPEAIEQLLAAERPVPAETVVSSARVLVAVMAQVAAVPAMSASSAGGSAPDAGASMLARVVTSKLLIAAVSFSLGGATVALLQPERPHADIGERSPTMGASTPLSRPESVDGRPQDAEAAPVPPAVPVVPDQPASLGGGQADKRSTVPRPAPRAVAPVATVAPIPERAADRLLAEERAALDMVRTALGRGRAEEALEGLLQHEVDFPQGQLGEERASLHVQALMSLGRIPEARERLRGLKREHPTSIVVPALEEALQEGE